MTDDLALVGLVRRAHGIRGEVTVETFTDRPAEVFSAGRRVFGGTPEGRARVIAQEPVGRMGRPEEIAAAVVWLCSDAAAFVVGHAMVIDGGQTV